MAVFWTSLAGSERARLFTRLADLNPLAALDQDDAIEALASTLDGVATYARLPNGSLWVPVNGYPVVIVYDREPGGDAVVLDVVHTNTAWKA